VESKADGPIAKSPNSTLMAATVPNATISDAIKAVHKDLEKKMTPSKIEEKEINIRRQKF
jgi:hypothetical protein